MHRFQMHSDESCDFVQKIATQPFMMSQLAATKLLWCYTALESGACLLYMPKEGVMLSAAKGGKHHCVQIK